jgi:hypothetical protein
MPIQSVVFNKADKWTNAEMARFLAEHDLKPIKAVHETKKQFRWRIANPRLFNRYISHRVNYLGRKVLTVIGIYQ